MQYDDPAGRLTPFEYECLIKHSCFLMNGRSNGKETAEKGGEMSDVMRWTSATVQPAPDAGGFVAYGDYLDLKRELSAAQKDAERYRWLRDTANKADIQTALLSGLQPRFIDDAIDAAIAAEQQPPHA